MGPTMKKVLFLCILLCIPVFFVPAHPHMFIDTRVTFQFDDGGLKGFWVTWWFDGGFTSMILTDYDFDRNGDFAGNEVAAIEGNAFSNLKNYNYFLYVYRNGARIFPNDITDFTAYMEENRLVYEFFVPARVPGSYDWETVKLAIYDDTFYCDIGYVENNPIMSRGYYDYKIASSLAKDDDTAITYDNSNASGGRSGKSYTGYANPLVVTLQFRRK